MYNIIYKYRHAIKKGLKRGFVENSEKCVAPLRLLKFDWMKVLHKYRFVHTPYPHEKVSLQIYTDLRNGPESWEKL